MKTISKREGKNYEIEVKGDLHQYPDGSVHTVKEGKAVWGEGGSGAGYSVEETKTTVFEDSITGSENNGGYYAAMIDTDALINADQIVVTYNGTEYTVEKRIMTADDGEEMVYGAELILDDGALEGVDFSVYPFVIASAGVESFYQTMLFMPTEGPNTVKIEQIEETVVPTDEFKAAVAASSTPAWIHGELGDPDEDNHYTVVVDMTIGEIIMAALAGSLGVEWGGLGLSGLGIGRGIFTAVSDRGVTMITHDNWQPVLYRGANDAETGKTVFSIMSDPTE